MFRKLRKCDIKNSSKSYSFFQKFGSKHGSPLQINCENFIMGCTVGFRAIFNQRLAFTTLDKNELRMPFI